jgi:hypothetical protein
LNSIQHGGKKTAQSQFPATTLFLLFASLAPVTRDDKYANTNEAQIPLDSHGKTQKFTRLSGYPHCFATFRHLQRILGKKKAAPQLLDSKPINGAPKLESPK